MPDSNLEVLQDAAQTRFGLDLNGALRVATGLDLDANGISEALFGSEINQNLDGLLAVLGGGLLLDGTTNSYAETADNVALDILGDIEITVEYSATSSLLSTQNLLAKWTPAAQQSYRLALLPLFDLAQIHTSTTGANTVTQQLAIPRLPKSRALRVTLDVDNGAAGRTARFFTALSLDGPFTEVSGSPVITAGVTTIFNSTGVLRLGALGNGTEAFVGRIHRAELRNGIGGTVVANPDFRNLAQGTTNFTDGAGRNWTLGSTAQVV